MQKILFMASKAIHQNHILQTVTHVLWVVGHAQNKLHHLESCFYNAFLHMKYKNMFVFMPYVKHEMQKSDKIMISSKEVFGVCRKRCCCKILKKAQFYFNFLYPT